MHAAPVAHALANHCLRITSRPHCLTRLPPSQSCAQCSHASHFSRVDFTDFTRLLASQCYGAPSAHAHANHCLRITSRPHCLTRLPPSQSCAQCSHASHFSRVDFTDFTRLLASQCYGAPSAHAHANHCSRVDFTDFTRLAPSQCSS